jgi:alcohol dehydrogenase YqhD (iron-dependent ADH family)
MKRTAILKKLNQYVDNIFENLDNISTLLELDLEDDELSLLSEQFKKIVEEAISENEDCNYNDIINYIENNY